MGGQQQGGMPPQMPGQQGMQRLNGLGQVYGQGNWGPGTQWYQNHRAGNMAQGGPAMLPPGLLQALHGGGPQNFFPPRGGGLMGGMGGGPQMYGQPVMMGGGGPTMQGGPAMAPPGMFQPGNPGGQQQPMGGAPQGIPPQLWQILQQRFFNGNAGSGGMGALGGGQMQHPM